MRLFVIAGLVALTVAFLGATSVIHGVNFNAWYVGGIILVVLDYATNYKFTGRLP